jgi:predicted metal-dependent hydrolase
VAFKQFNLDGIGTVTIYKRRTSRVIRLTVGGSGEIKVTIPVWAPYRSGLTFAASRQAWITANKPAKQRDYEDGQTIGKSHRLVLLPDSTSTKASTHVRGTEVRVRYPAHLPANDLNVQKAIERAALRALKLQAKRLLKIRLDELAERHDYDYRSLTIKQLKGRWGSCDQDKNIVLNLFLMQVPWHLIDYVILHELAHTKVLRHGAPFWAEMQKYTADAPLLRRELHEYQPVLRLKT